MAEGILAKLLDLRARLLTGSVQHEDARDDGLTLHIVVSHFLSFPPKIEGLTKKSDCAILYVLEQTDVGRFTSACVGILKESLFQMGSLGIFLLRYVVDQGKDLT